MVVYVVVAAALIVSIAALIFRLRMEKEDNHSENIEADKKAKEKADSLCAEDEDVKAVCRIDRKGGYAYLTNKRFFIDNKNGLQTILLDDIKKVTFKKMDGNKARYPSDCFTIIIYVDGTSYKLYRYSNSFDVFSGYLMRNF